MKDGAKAPYPISECGEAATEISSFIFYLFSLRKARHPRRAFYASTPRNGIRF